MNDLVEKVSSAKVMADFADVVMNNNLWGIAPIYYLRANLFKKEPYAKISRALKVRLYELINKNSGENEEEILSKKVSELGGISYLEVFTSFNSPFLGVNKKLVESINELMGISEEVYLPIITRDGADIVNGWFDFKRKELDDRSPREYFRENGITPIIIANLFGRMNGFYTGTIFPSEESKLLFPKSPLITQDKRKKYSVGGINRVIFVDDEEYPGLKGDKYPNLFPINIQSKRNLKRELEKAKKFLNL